MTLVAIFCALASIQSPTFPPANFFPVRTGLIAGFSPVNSVKEREVESLFDENLQAGDLRDWLKRLSYRPHHVGSPYGLENAQLMRQLYASFGFDAKIETFYVLFPSPKERELSMGDYRASLIEPPIPGDSSSHFSTETLPPYNAYSKDGDVSGKLVYVNYGMPDDYDKLQSMGISVRGRIAIARYGGGWRGIKPKVAAEHGAIGCIIYSDPRDDGYEKGDVYPAGGWRNEHSVQRGSVADMPIYPGDPLTPNVGATKDAKRLAIKDAVTITKIPCLPISYGDALPLLRDLGGPVAPETWRGGLPITYHVGPGKTNAHLKLVFNWDTVEARDVIATMPGTDLKDQLVIRGNHHDGWVCGADDPLSGQVAMLEEAKSIGLLAKTGWRPRRTIVFCSWDGEEPGLLGSTEWVETHADELASKAAVYINSDSNSRGYVGLSGSHCLEGMLNGVIQDVPDAETKFSLSGRRRARDLMSGTPEAKKRARTAEDLPTEALGSGSDFSPFLQHLGIASVDIGFGGEGDGTQYHSAYDTFEWVTRFSDTDFSYGIELAKTAGRTILRFADADSLPMDYARFADTVEKYGKELVTLCDTMRTQTEENNRALADGSWAATLDPRRHSELPAAKPPVPVVILKPLLDAIARLKDAAKNARPSDTKLIQAERALLGPGLPGRPWYRHTIYAPGLYTGYGVKTLPGVREAIEQRRWKEAEDQAKIAADALDRLSALLR